MKKIFTLVVPVLLMNVMARSQVNLVCNPGESIAISYTGGMASCVVAPPANGSLQYSYTGNCNDATNDLMATQTSCDCCPLFTGDCIRYTNTVTSATSDQFIIEEITYNVTILSILPVKLANLKAYERNAAVQVVWTILQENNINRYELERSYTGEQFVKIGALPSKGNSDIMRTYELPDLNPVSGVNYYRIKTVALSGEISYSPVVKVNRHISFADVTVAPNPLTGNIATLHYTLPKGNYLIEIASSSGQQVFIKNIQHGGGSAAQTIEFSKIPASGLYRLKLAGEGIVIYKKIIR